MTSTDAFHRSASILIATLLILLNTVIHTKVYGNRNYREDEINSIHAALIKSPSEIVQWMAGDVHPPGWRLFADFWVDSFGTAEGVTRWSSKLINLLTFALVFQLGKQLCDRRLALYAVALLGVYGFASNGAFELRPYSMLVAITTALHLVYYRWLVKPAPKVMVGYVALGMAAIYTHFFALFIFAAHAVFLLVFRRFNRKVYLDTFLMWVFIALSFSVWLLPVLAVVLGPFAGGYYADGLAELYQRLHFRPEVVFGFLMLMSLFAPRLAPRLGNARTGSSLRWHHNWHLLYPLVLLLATLLIAYLANSVYSSLNARGLQTLVMLIALLMALGLRLLPAPAGIILILLLYIQAPQNIASQPSNAPYREMVASMMLTYQDDSLLVTEFAWSWRWLTPAAYFMMDFTPDQMSKTRMYHVIDPADHAHPPTYPDRLLNVSKSFDSERFDSQLPAHNQLWLLQQGAGNRWGDAIQQWLDQNYAWVQTKSWDKPYHASYDLSEYVRAPEGRSPMLLAGNNLQLYDWTLLDEVDVNPCQTIMVESWWQLGEKDKTPYTLLIILADSDGDGQLGLTASVPANVFTSDWRANKFYRDHSALKVPCNIESGRFDLLLAVKETISGQELPLNYADGNPIGNVFYLTTLTVPAE